MNIQKSIINPPMLFKTRRIKWRFLQFGTRCPGRSLRPLRIMRDSIENRVENREIFAARTTRGLRQTTLALRASGNLRPSRQYFRSVSGQLSSIKVSTSARVPCFLPSLRLHLSMPRRSLSLPCVWPSLTLCFPSVLRAVCPCHLSAFSGLLDANGCIF